MVGVAEWMVPSQLHWAPEGQRPGSAAARTECERPELLMGMYAALREVGLLSGMTGELPWDDGWYAAIKDNVQGPLSVDDRKDQWSRGEIGADTLCWREDLGEWPPLTRLHNLAVTIAPRPCEDRLRVARLPRTLEEGAEGKIETLRWTA